MSSRPHRAPWLTGKGVYVAYALVRELKDHLAPLPEEARRKVLGQNAQRFYRLAG